MSKSCKYRLIFRITEICKKKCQTICFFCRNILTNRKLTTWQLSANHLDDLLMKGFVGCE